MKDVDKLIHGHIDCTSSSSDYERDYHRTKEHALIDHMDKVQVLLPNSKVRYITFIQLYNY